MITEKQSSKEKARVSLAFKYIGEEFPGEDKANTGAMNGLTIHASWDSNSGWQGKGWGRRMPQIQNKIPVLENIEERRHVMLLRREGEGALVFDKATGGVFSTNNRAYELLKKGGELLRTEKSELTDAFKEAGLRVA